MYCKFLLHTEKYRFAFDVRIGVLGLHISWSASYLTAMSQDNGVEGKNG